MIPHEYIEELTRRTDIVELVGSYVQLKRKGRLYGGLCPFHSEKTPSFYVYPDTQSFYCFGCQAAGDAISFVRKINSIDYPEAVKLLAARAGMPEPQEDDKTGRMRSRILSMNKEAARFFHACLNSTVEEARQARAYWRRRGLDDKTIARFGLGYAPDDGQALYQYLRDKGYNQQELDASGLFKRSQSGRIYCLFWKRVMTPIFDLRGNIIAFGGRVLDDSKPKYLNTSDTPAFRKSNHLFALNFAKNCCAERMILCEGYMDVIALHAAGFEFAVATLGTAITPNHARIFSKYTKQVIITYDSDEAGQNAANKAMRILGEVGMEVRVLKLDGAKDPDEYIVKFGADKFRHALDGSRTGFDYKMDNILAKYDLTVSSDRIRASGELCELIAGYQSQIERAVYIDQITKKLKIAPEILQNTVDKARTKQLAQIRQREGRDAQNEARKFGDRVNPDAAKDPRAAAAEENLLGLLLIFPEYREEIASGRESLTGEDFTTEFNRRVFEAIMRLHGTEEGFRFELLGEEFSPEEMGRIRRMEVARQMLTQNGPTAFRTALAGLRDLRRERDLKKTGNLNDFLQMKRNKLHKGKVDAT